MPVNGLSESMSCCTPTVNVILLAGLADGLADVLADDVATPVAIGTSASSSAPVRQASAAAADLRGRLARCCSQ